MSDGHSLQLQPIQEPVPPLEEPDLCNFKSMIQVWSTRTLRRMNILIEQQLEERRHDPMP